MLIAEATSAVIRRAPRAIAGAVIAVALSAALAVPAGAETDAYSYSIYGSGADRLGAPADVAVDNSVGPSAHDVYVTDPSNFRVEKFSPSGQFILMFGEGVDKTTGADVCTAASGDDCGPGATEQAAFEPGPLLVAVDSSNGSSAGDVYVGYDRRVEKFDPSGHRLTAWGDEGALEYSLLGSIAVAPDGELFVLEETGPEHFYSYTPSGAEISSFLTPYGGPYGVLAADASGDFFMAREGGIEKLTVADADLGSIDAGRIYGLAIDLPGDTIYASRESGLIDRFAADCTPGSCSPEASFAQGYFNEAQFERHRIAVDAGRKAVYATNAAGAPGAGEHGGEIEVFLPGEQLPRATTGQGEPIREGGAVLSGVVDPNGTGPVASCRFEYVDDATYETEGFAEPSVADCDSTGGLAAETAVHALITGLEAGTTYHYRLSVAGSTGATAGVPRAFEMGNKPVVQTKAPSEVNATTVSLAGTVGDLEEEEITTCYFELVDRGGEPDGYEGAKRVDCAPKPPFAGRFLLAVSSLVSGLKPEEPYRFRLVAANSGWTTVGESQGFTTSPAEPEPEEEEPGPPPRPRHVHCSARVCSVKLTASSGARTWVSPRFPASYGWLFSLHSSGRQLPHSGLRDGCHATFRGHGVSAMLNACPDRFRLTYRGTGSFKVRWRVFEQCRCTNVNHRERRPRRAPG